MTTRLDAAGARARLAIAFALTLCALTFASSAQAAPPDFSWTSSLSTTQAGGHPNLTLNYASSSTQSLTRLDVDLPQGMMHRNNLSGACASTLFLPDACPVRSTVGTVSAQLVVARVRITVPGTIYQLSEPSGDADATFGVVLRPPLSGLGLTSKIFIRNQISFTNGGGLRSSLVGPMSSMTVLGATVPARLAQLRLTYNSQTPTGGVALISNPTSCRAQTFRAIGTFSDGAKRGHDSSFTTTGCPAVPFAPTAEIQLDNNTAGQRTLFSSMLHMHRPGTASSLSPGHVVLIGHDFDEIGDFDFEQIDSGPLCTEEQAASEAGCPADTAIGDLSADIEGFGTATGKTYMTNSPGHKTISEITLGGRIKVRFPGGLGGDNDSTLSFTGMPQLPFTSFRFRSTRAAAWITNTCAIRTTRTSARSWGDGHNVNQNVLPAPNCPPPAAPTITEGPDRGITINTSHVEYRFTGKEVDNAWECAMDDGPYAACTSPFVDDFHGEGVHSFSVRGVRGGVTGPATTATFTIDTVPPEVSFVGDEYGDVDGDGVADAPFRKQDFSFEFAAADATSGLVPEKLDCAIDFTDPTRPTLRGKVRPSYAAGRFQCDFVAAPGGPATISLTAHDGGGHVTVLKLSVIIDDSPPSIAIDESGVHFTDAGSPEIAFTIQDDSLRYEQGEVTVECYRKGWDGSVKGSAKIVTDRDTGRSKGFCSFADVPEGTYKVIVRGWDPVKKEGVAEGDLVVDRTAPTITLTNPEDADSDNDGVADKRFRPSFFDVFTEISDDGSGVDHEGTSCVAKVKNKGAIKGNIVVTQANRVTCSVGDLPDGDVDVEITTRNYVGTVTIVKRGFTVDTMPPTLSFTDTGDLDSDGDGVADAPFRNQDFSFEFAASDATSGLVPEKLDCAIDFKDPTQPTLRGKVRPSYAAGRFQCDFVAAPGGPATISLTAHDGGGHVTVLKLSVIIDDSPPSIAIDESGVHFTDAGSPEIAFTAQDDSLHHAQGELVYVCERKGWDGTVKGGSKIVTDRDTGRSKGFCVFPDTPEGSYKVVVKGWDYTKKEAIAEGDLVVDRSAPKIDLTNPADSDSDGDGVADDRWRSSSIEVAAEIEDPESGIDQGGTSCLAKVKNKGNVKGSITIMSANRVVCTVDGLPDEDVEVELSARNYVGTVTIVKRGFTVDTTGPTLSFTDTGDLDSDGDGFSDNRVRPARLGYEIRVDDARGIGVDPASGACDAKPRKGGVITGSVIISNGSAMRCSFENLPSGDTDIEIRAADYRGHVTVLKAAVTIETSP